MRFIHHKVFSIINSHLVDYPTPVAGYMSSFGSLSGLCLVIQIITGVLLTAHYTPHVSLAFVSVEHIMRDVNDGWLFRYYHSNGASVFFLCIYIHIAQNLGLEAGDNLWISGFLLYMGIMAAAFMGYIIPWGQMSFWGATVITNLFAAIPIVGQEISLWLWGGFSVDNPTLNRFFSFHYILPFLIVALVILHLSLLHLDESSDDGDEEYIEFYYYYFIKDLFAFILLIILFARLVFFKPNHISHPDNYTMASISVTPAHIIPEWYFLPFYGVLRSTPDKLGGLILMFWTLIDFFLISNIDMDSTSAYGEDEEDELMYLDEFDMDSDIVEDSDTGNLIILFFLGGQDIDEPYTDIATVLTLFQFLEYVEIPLDDEDV